MRPPTALLTTAVLLLAAAATAQEGSPGAAGAGAGAGETASQVAAAAAAHDPSTPIELSFAQALAAARTAPAVAVANAQLTIAESRLAAQRASVHASVSIASDAGLDLAGGSTVSASASGEASFDVLPFGPSQEALERAQDSVARASAELSAARRSAVVTVAGEYLAALRARQATTLRQEALALAQARLQAAEARNQAGAASDADVVSAQLDVAGATDDLAAAQRDARTARAALSQTLGMQLTPVDGATATLDTGPLATAPNLDGRSDIIAAALDLASAELDLRAARRDAGVSASAQLRFATSSRDAALALSASFDSATLQPSAAATVTLGANAVASTSLAAGVGLTIPLDAAAGAGLDAYRQAVSVARDQLARARDGASVEIADARRNLEGEQAQHDLQTRLVVQAQATLERTRARYDLGLVSILELRNAALTLHQAQLDQDRSADATLVAGLALAQSMAIDPMEVLR